MSSGQVFERVYRMIKGRLAEGYWLPGERIEPAELTSVVHASITPVRDVLHRLTGERLVETPEYNGFRIALLSEAALRDLYAWNRKLLGIALRAVPRPSRVLHAPAGAFAEVERAQASGAADLFLTLARATDSQEQVRAIEALNDRLAPFRIAEAHVLDGLAEEIDEIATAMKADNRKDLRLALDRYHRRRISMTPKILAWRQSARK